MPKTKRGRTTVIDIEVYSVSVVVTTLQDRALLKKLRRLGCDITDDEAAGFSMQESYAALTAQLSSGVVVIRLRDEPDTPFMVGKLAHEAFHAATFILRRAGVRFCSQSDEAFAYAIDCLVRRSLEFFNNGRTR
jgi:hypothetical protein